MAGFLDSSLALGMTEEGALDREGARNDGLRSAAGLPFDIAASCLLYPDPVQNPFYQLAAY
jgi:hypothetical protein